MVYFFYFILALFFIGLFWHRRKSPIKSRDMKAWPASTWSKGRIREKLLTEDPLEIAKWLTRTFQSKEDLWPALKEALAESGLEGLYITWVEQEKDHRLLAVKALALIGSRFSLPVLIKALNSQDDEFSFEAMEALKKLKLPESCELLISALIRGQGAVPSCAASALITLGNIAVDPILKALVEAPDDHKAILIEVLGEISPKNLWSVLIPYLGSNHGLVRQKAVEAIGLSESPLACSYLLPLLKDQDWKVRAATAKVLGQLGCREAIRELRTLCQDKVWHVQVNAREALEELGAALED